MKDLQYYLSLNYHKIIFQEEGAFIAEVQELPGCVSDGDTEEEALRNLRDAMEVWIESRVDAGLPVPEPRSIEDFSGKFLLRLSKSLHQRLATLADSEGVSLNQFVVSLLGEAVGRLDERQSTIAASEEIARALSDAVHRLERLTEPSRAFDTRKELFKHAGAISIRMTSQAQEAGQIGTGSLFSGRAERKSTAQNLVPASEA